MSRPSFCLFENGGHVSACVRTWRLAAGQHRSRRRPRGATVLADGTGGNMGKRRLEAFSDGRLKAHAALISEPLHVTWEST
jgi:hypothetical protein